jgi:tetratricopeptide (TPR) repeat protein
MPHTSLLAELMARGRGLLGTDAEGALKLARQVLHAAPANLEATLLAGAALRRGGNLELAADLLQSVAERAATAWGPQFEYGVALAMLGRTDGAIQHLQAAVALNPKAWPPQAALHDQLGLLGRPPSTKTGALRPTPPRPLVEACFRGDPEAELRLAEAGFPPNDPLMIKVLGDAALGWDLEREAEPFLARAVAMWPDFAPLRLTYALALNAQEKLPEAVREVAVLRRAYAGFELMWLDAALRAQTGDYATALDLYDALLAQTPNDIDLLLARGHVLKTLGRQDEALAAYRLRTEAGAGAGAGYWAIANLKVIPFDAGDLRNMRERLAAPSVGEAERIDLHFAMGKAFEDVGDFAAAFQHYEAANSIRRDRSPFDAASHAAFVDETIRTFTPDFFASRAGAGSLVHDPIFIVGLPRSGSTLIEQILASHSSVEGTSELPDLRILAGQARLRSGVAARSYPARLADLPLDEFRRVGEDYLARTRLHRRLDRPFFTDKFPGNVLHAGFIHLILPRARIIDVRRDPMACGLSAFKQNFAEGQAYSADLGWFASYYRDYERLTDHFEAVLPGRILRVQYEDLVADPEGGIRRLLDHCGLAFEPGCLRFHEADRPVRTASSEQVRRPLDRHGIEQWRHFEPWLTPLREALGRS